MSKDEQFSFIAGTIGKLMGFQEKVENGEHSINEASITLEHRVATGNQSPKHVLSLTIDYNVIDKVQLDVSKESD